MISESRQTHRNGLLRWSKGMFGSQKAAGQAHPKTAQVELFARTSLALLDNPIWHALKSAHHSLARTNGDVSPALGNGDYFSRTIVKEPGRAAGRTTHPGFRVALQPSPCRVVP